MTVYWSCLVLLYLVIQRCQAPVSAGGRRALRPHVSVEPTEDALPVFSVSVGCLAPAEEAFVAHSHARATCDGIEAVRDGRLPRALQRMLFELPRHPKLAPQIHLAQLATPDAAPTAPQDNAAP